MKGIRLVLFLVIAAVIAVLLNRATISDHNTTATRFDALIVLGNPTTDKGNPSAEQRERVLESVREYQEGVAPAIIMTGGAAHNHFVEAEGMAALAVKQGVPESAIIREPRALNTIQNLYYSSEIMHQHGWSSAEVISSSAHLPRAALILQALARSHPDLAIQWSTHAAHWPREYNLLHKAANLSVEAARCMELRIFGFPKSPFLP